MGALSVTGKQALQAPFGPLPNLGGEAVEFGDLEALERVLSSRDYAAFIVEPVQGEAGVYVPPPGFLKGAERDLP